MHSVNRGYFRKRNKFFYVVFLVGAPLWLSLLALFLCWDIAQNFRGQINAGYNQLMAEKGMR